MRGCGPSPLLASRAPAAERLGQPSQRRAFRDGCKGPGLPMTSQELEPGARPGCARRPAAAVTGKPAAASAMEVVLEPARAGLQLSQARPVPARAALIRAGARSPTAFRSFGASLEHCCAVTWPSGRRPAQASAGHRSAPPPAAGAGRRSEQRGGPTGHGLVLPNPQLECPSRSCRGCRWRSGQCHRAIARRRTACHRCTARHRSVPNGADRCPARGPMPPAGARGHQRVVTNATPLAS